MEDERIELAELYLYLSEGHYDTGQSNFILTAFKRLQTFYDAYVDMNPEMVDRASFIRKYVNILKKIEPITFLTDINTNNDFLRAIKPVGNVQIPVGYIRDELGNYKVTKVNPQYWCPLRGLTTRSLNNVTLLYDDTIEFHMELSYGTIMHELTHIDQEGFDLPWYILNRNVFIKLLQEGHAINVSKYCENKMSSRSTIPFAYDEATAKFQLHDDNLEYRVYKYLYYKFQVLLGDDFLNTWAKAKKDTNFMIKACRLIDAKYGKGTFKKIYECVLIILNSQYNVSKDNLKVLLEEQKDMTNMISLGQDETLEELMSKYKTAVDTIEKPDLFKTSYEAELNKLLSTKKTFDGISALGNSFISKLNEKIDNFTESKYREELETFCSNLEDEIQVKMDIDYFKIITGVNANALNEMINNPNHITDAVVKLESLVLKCIQKDMDNRLDSGSANYQKYRDYIYNVGNKCFSLKAMKSVKKQIDYLSMSAFLAEHSNYLSPTESTPIK